MRGSIKDIRKVIFDLRPMVLDDLGLVPALKRYVREFSEQWGFPMELKVNGLERRIPSVVEVAGFRIVQEALNNVQKHAKASKVSVTVDFGKEMVVVSVTDNGQGFAVSEALADRGEHFGLLSMRERVELLDGTCTIESAPGRGVSITARLPIREGGEDGGA